MTSQPPLVSVIIPAYCAAKFIAKTIESVLAQTYKNIEVLVVDDGSTDETYSIANQFAARDPRLKVLRQPNRGVACARNLGVDHASGEFIAPLDADDLWLPQSLEKRVAAFAGASENCGIVYSWSFDIDENDSPIGTFHAYRIEGDVYTTLLCHNFLGNASCTLIRSACLKDVGPYSLEFKERGVQGCEDWELYARVAEKYQFKAVPEFLVAYRRSRASMSSSCTSMARSHRLVLRHAQRRMPVPEAVLHLSESSFYVHLAHQSYESGRNPETQTWLFRALRAECITPLLRVEVYLLFLKTLLGVRAKLESTSKVRPETAATALGGKAFVPQPARLYWRQTLGKIVHKCLQVSFDARRKRVKSYEQALAGCQQ